LPICLRWFGLFPFRSPLLRVSIFLSLPPSNEMFQFPGSNAASAIYSLTGNTLSCAGFPHSEIFGSTLTYSSPKHIGVGSVLHLLLVPRHPPCALHYLI